MKNTYNININIQKFEVNVGFFRNLIRRIRRDVCPGGSGTGCQKFTGIRLVRSREEAIGVGFHRSGWPYVFGYLESIATRDGILFDDFVEQNFCYKDKPTVYKEPWVGIFHHPPTIPYFGNQREDLALMMQKPEFTESAKNLKLAIALSEHLAVFLRKHLKCPVVVLTHPASINFRKWSHNAYHANKSKKLVQIGYYLRNTQLINQINFARNTEIGMFVSNTFRKVRLWTNLDWVQKFDERVRKYWDLEGTRKHYGGVSDLVFVPASQYDDLLYRNVVVMEVFDASASNGVLDCIVRNTPIVINKNPAVVEYLGEKYPLYFTHPDEIQNLIYSESKIKAASKYLENLDKSKLSAQYFIKQVMHQIEKL